MAIMGRASDLATKMLAPARIIIPVKPMPIVYRTSESSFANNSLFTTTVPKTQSVEGISVLSAQVDAPNADTLREMCDWFRERMGSGVVVLGAVVSGRPSLVASVTPDLVERGVHAGHLIKEVAGVVGGGGGGRPTMAHAGGRDPERLSEALACVPGLVKASLSG